MKKICLFIVCIASINLVYSQNIKGIVYDEKEQPISGAQVFLDGTSIGTFTDDEGKFEINGNESTLINLVINASGYESITIRNTENDFLTVRMTPKTTHLKEVVVTAKKSRFKRADKLKVFREEFLGTKTTAAKSCEILNESKINFKYDARKRQLVATSEEPIKIYNPFLGYYIEYHIKQCFINFSSGSIRSSAVSGWAFSGTTYFRDLTNDSTSYAAKRKMSYRGSQLEFFRNLTKRTLDKTNFQLFHGSRYCDPDKYFTIIERKNDYIVIINNDKVKANQDFYQSFILEYQGKPDSEIFFRTRTIKVYKSGNYFANGTISLGGTMSEKRIGDMLPLDYKRE